MRKYLFCAALLFLLGNTVSPAQDLVFYDGFSTGVDYELTLQEGQVILPSAVTFDVATLSVETLVGQTAPDEAGAFELQTFASPHLVLARSGAGNTVLMGLLGLDDNVVDARSTAVVSVFLTANGGALPSDAHLAVLDALDRDAALDGLEQAIEAALGAGADAFANYNKDVSLALQETMQQLREEAGIGKWLKDLTVLPDETKSGASLEKRFQAFQVINGYKRPLKAFVDLEQCSGESGVVDAGRDGCEATSQTLDVRSVAGGRSLADAIIGAINAGYAMFFSEEGNDIQLDPIRSQRLPLTIPGSFDSATYVAYIGGPGGSEGVRAELSQARLDELFLLEVKFVLFDLMIPAVTALVIPSLADDNQRLGRSELAADLVADVANAVNNEVRNAINGGNYKGAFRMLWDEFVANQGAVRQRVLDFLQAAVADRADAGRAADFVDYAQDLNRALAAFDIAIAGLETTLTYGQVLSSERVASWRVQVTQPEVEITPSAAEVKCDEDQEFRAVIRDLNGDGETVFTYRWQIDPDAGVLVDCRGREGNDLTTSCDTVSLRPNFVRDLFDLSVTVAVTPTNGDPDYDVGEATAVADVQLAHVRLLLTPYASSIDNGETQQLNVELRPVNSSDRCETSDLKTQWFNTSDFGDIDVQEGVQVERRSVIYSANDNDKEGQDTVSVDVVYQRGDGPVEELGSKEADIRVEEEPRILDGTLAIVEGPSPGNRACVSAAIIVPPDAGEAEGTRYRLDGRGGYDPDFYRERVLELAPPYDTEDTNQFFPGFPSGTRSIGLSAVCSNLEQVPDTFRWLESRFGSGWDWKIFVTR